MTPRAPSSRIVGFDVARALAVFGMVVVNFRGKARAYDSEWTGLMWLVDRAEGKFAALFVLLAGVGIALRSRSVLARGQSLGVAQRALLQRAAILFALGLLLVHVWSFDILHFYGVYLAIAALLLRASNRMLWGLAVAVTLFTIVLHGSLEWSHKRELWTPLGAASRLSFNGNYPTFPWIAFLLVGLWLGRQNLMDDRTRRRVLGVSLAVLVLVETVSCMVGPAGDGIARLGPELAGQLRSWPRPPRPGFVVSGTAFALFVVCAAVELTRSRTEHRWVIALVATGQLAFTLYLAHVVAILVPLQHGIFAGSRLETVVAYAVGFYVVAVASSLWWRCRWAYGPVETIIRQITQPAPRPRRHLVLASQAGTERR